MSNIAILPIKSDSKRIPMKLFKNFCGKPLYMHVVDEVKRLMHNYGIIDKIVVTSPDKWFINKTFNEYGLDFILRPKELAGDVELTEVMKHATKKISATSEDNIIQIQLNKPLTKASDIMECIKVFEDGNYDSLSTVQEIGTAIIGEHLESSRTAEKKYKSQAICKIWKYDILMNSTNLYSYGDNHCYHPIAKHHIEIDDMEDFRIAEALMKAGF